MNDNDVDKLLRDLARAAQSEPVQPLDVRVRVMQTLSMQSRPAPLDFLPIAFAGAAVAVAAGFIIALLHAWQTLTEPWVAYMP